MTWPYSGNAQLTQYRCPDDDFDPDDFYGDYGIAIEQPSERERREHRAARTPLAKSDPRAGSTAEGLTHPEGTSE